MKTVGLFFNQLDEKLSRPFKPINKALSCLATKVQCVPAFVFYLLFFLYAWYLCQVSFISINTNSQVYDYEFHLSRIVSQSYSFKNGDFLANLNFLQIPGNGYGTPMFYGNWILIIPSIVFMNTESATIAYAAYALELIYATACTSFFAIHKMTGSKSRGLLLALALPLVFPCFGYGMTAAAPFGPLLIYCIYKVLYQERYNPILLGVVIALLVQTHIISTIVLAVLSAFVFLTSFRKWSVKGVLSFSISVLIGILLSSGFILQYLEQMESQTFFVNWTLRDFPFDPENLLQTGSIIDAFDVVANNPSRGVAFAQPITVAMFFVCLLFVRQLKPYSRYLIVAAFLLIAFQSNLLPWETILKYTFFGMMQYTQRLLFFLPVLLYVALYFSAPKILLIIFTFMQLSFYNTHFLKVFTEDSKPYKTAFQLNRTNKEVMDTVEELAKNAYENPLLYSFNTSGDEYFNIDINHENVRNGEISSFHLDEFFGSVYNIENTYNTLEFDVQLWTETPVEIILPRIWYKGYEAAYTNGATGSQPELKTRPLTNAEKENFANVYRPESDVKVLSDGQATIVVNSSGHVKVTYKKTVFQMVGFFIEGASFVLVALYTIFKLIDNNQKKFQQRLVRISHGSSNDLASN